MTDSNSFHEKGRQPLVYEPHVYVCSCSCCCYCCWWWRLFHTFPLLYELLLPKRDEKNSKIYGKDTFKDKENIRMCMFGENKHNSRPMFIDATSNGNPTSPMNSYNEIITTQSNLMYLLIVKKKEQVVSSSTLGGVCSNEQW